MIQVEDMLMDELCFGHSHSGKNSERLHVPTLWEVAHDLANYVKKGLLSEIPGTFALLLIFLNWNRIFTNLMLLIRDF